MALSEVSSEMFQVGQQQLAAQDAAVHILRPQQNEGVFLLEQTPLPTFPHVAVESAPTKHRKDLDTDHAEYYQRWVTLSDGTRFYDLVGVARNPISEVPVVKTKAWWTRLDGGFNKDTLDRFNAAGRHTYAQDTPINRFNSLYHNAWNLHVGLDNIGIGFDTDIQTKVIRLEGDSNGAMTGTGAIAYADEFDRIVEDAFLVDPCMVEKIGKEIVLKFLRHPDYLANEIFSLVKQVGRTILDEEMEAGNLLETIEFSREYLIGNLLLIRALAWGELGHLAAHIPEDQKANYYLFDYSIANMKKLLVDIIRGPMGGQRPDVTTETHHGTHMSIVNPRTIKAKVDYLAPLPVAA